MVDSIPLEKLVVPACVLDVNHNITPDYRISVDDINKFENQHGKIPTGCLFIAHTGWCKFWQEHQKYRNIDSKGKMHFPGFSHEAIQILIDRQVVGIAIDTFSPDSGDEDFPIHKMLLHKNIYIIENITNADKLPPTGSFVAALPMKILDAVEAPARVIAFVPRRKEK
jgi:kynurenine formamidase